MSSRVNVNFDPRGAEKYRFPPKRPTEANPPVKIHHYPILESTNLEAKRLWEDAPTVHQPFAVVAREQNGGVGRNGRPWHSPVGGLWLTMAWPIRKPLAAYGSLPLAAGEVLARTLEEHYHLLFPPRIKWPNDIFVFDRKLAGILCSSETHQGRAYILIGVGVNGFFPATALGTELRHPATTLGDLLAGQGMEEDIDSFGRDYVGRLEVALEQFEERGLAPFLEGLRMRLAWIGERVVAEDTNGQHRIAGVLEGVDEEGRLVLNVDGARRAFLSGEISRLSPEIPRGKTLV